MENWNWTKIFLFFSFIIFLGSLLLRQESAITQDLGRHLRLGEMIVSGGPPNGEARDARKCALYSNCLTYTYPDYPFVNHHWGSEVIFYLIYKLGGFGGLIVLKALILGMAFLITAKHAIDTSLTDSHAPPLAGLGMTIVIIFLAVQMMADRLTLRPEIFGYLLFSWLFMILNQNNNTLNTRSTIESIVGIPVIMLLWVNLHISFVFGLILIWIWGISKLTSNFMRSDLPGVQPTFKVGPLAIAIISTLVTLINPNGIKGALAPLNILKEYGYTIAENMTPFFMAQFKPQPEYWIYGGLLAAVAIIGGIRGFRGIREFKNLALIVFSVFSLMAVRHLPFLGLVIPVALTSLLYGIRLPREVTGRYLPRNDSVTWITSGILIILAITNPVPLAYAKLSPVGLGADKRYEAAIQFVKENNLQGSIWNNYDIGSFLEWALPEYKTFVDGRPEAFPVEFFRDIYKPMQEKPEIWNQETEKYDIQWIFAALTDTTPWFQQWWMMIQSRPEWKIVYLDDYSTILVKENGINKNVKPVGKAKTLQIIKNLDVLY